MKRRYSRAAQRGAVFVESIIVVVFFTLCFLGVVYFREVYIAKMQMQRLARSSAMAHAMNACSGDIKAGLENDLAKNAPSPPTNDDHPGDQTLDPKSKPGTKEHDSLDSFDQSKAGTPFDRVTVITLKTSANATTKRSTTGKEEGFRADVASQSFVTCGDPVRNGGIEQVFPAIGGVFESFF